MEIVEFGLMTAEKRQELEGEETDPFDSTGITLKYRRKDRHVGLRDDVGALVASTGMVVVEVEVGRAHFPVVGLGGVIVKAQHRGRGFGRKIVEAALAKANSLGPAFAMLFCHRNRAPLYRKLGFVMVDDEVMVRQPGGYAQMPQQTMWRRLRPNAEWPAGTVTLHSFPF